MFQRHRLLFLTGLLTHLYAINGYTFSSPIDNLLYISHHSTLYAISSSHLHQLYWSNTNRSLLLLHRRVPLHPSLDQTDQGVSVLIYHPSRHLLLICARSASGRCVLYDANDISRVYDLDPTIETNYLGCTTGCYTFLAGNTIRSALPGHRLDRNGNIINSQIELDKDLTHFNIRYEYQSDDRTSMTTLMFQSHRRAIPEYLYGFDHQDYTYYLTKSSRLARLCQSSVLMHLTYEEIPITRCATPQNRSSATGAFFAAGELYVIYGDTLCRYLLDDIDRAFQRSKLECDQGRGYRLEYLIDKNHSEHLSCESVLQRAESTTNSMYQCQWQSYRTNLYVDGLIGATGDFIYRTAEDHVKIQFVFIDDSIVVIATSARRIFKFIRKLPATLQLVHTMVYDRYPLNSEYVVDYTRQSLIFAVGTELHRYAYNSCSLYDTCRSCIGSQLHDHQICQWIRGQCIPASKSADSYSGCPPSIDHIDPLNASVNMDQVILHITGSFDDVPLHAIKVMVTFPPLPTQQNQYSCTVKTVNKSSLTCLLILPKQPMNGTISMHIQPARSLTLGNTDIMGSTEFHETFHVYVPHPHLVPDYGPSAGGTRIRVNNLMLDTSDQFLPSIKVYLGKYQCPITRIDPQMNAIECLSQGCSNDRERLELLILVDEQPWLMEKTYFQCRANPILIDWSPKKATVSGGHRVSVTGQNLDVVQEPKMQLVSESLNLTLVSPCTSLSPAQMDCLTPPLNITTGMDLPLKLNISFLMDYARLTPGNNTFTLFPDPIYDRFEDSSQYVDSTGIIYIRGSNLASSHSLDQVDIVIDGIHNACRPLNYTDTDLTCSLSESATKYFQHDEPFVEVHVGRSLIYSIGRIMFSDANQSIPLLSGTVPESFGIWPIFILLVLSFTSICTLFLSILMITRRRFYQSFHHLDQTNQPPFYLQSIWSEIGKQYQIQREKLILGEKLGQGRSVDIYQGEWKQSRKKSTTVAVKILHERSISSIMEYLIETNRMKTLSHRNILSLLGVSWDPTREAMIVYPLMKNGDLRSFIANEIHQPTMRQVLKWAIQIADGMEYFVSMQCVHGDLAARNCLLDDEFVCRIADFSLTRDLLDRDYCHITVANKENATANSVYKSKRVPLRWLSPETIESGKYTTQSDTWSFGILIWELFSRGNIPYPNMENADIYKAIKNGYRLPSPNFCPALLYDSVMCLCWHADPLQRPSFTQLSHDIRHILHRFELDQQQQLSSADDDTTIVQRYPIDQASTQSIGTFHRPEMIEEHENDDEHEPLSRSSTDMFDTAGHLPEYAETSIAHGSQ